MHTLTDTSPEALAEIEKAKAVHQTSELFLLFPMGSQYDHLIKMLVEKLGLLCIDVDPGQIRAADVSRLRPKGIILSGSRASVNDDDRPEFDETIFDLGIPVLGICYGFQLWAKRLGAQVKRASRREYHTEILQQLKPRVLLDGLPEESMVQMNHSDRIEPHPSLEVLARTSNSPVAAAQYGNLLGVQFHPEVSHTVHGEQVLHNFCFKICGAKDVFPAKDVAEEKIANLRTRIGQKKRVLVAISGGSDSSTLGYLLKQAVDGRPGQIFGVYIKGVDRPDDEAHVLKYFDDQSWINLRVFDASSQFLTVLKGKIKMREKRIAVREVYKEVIEDEADLVGADFIAQGTLYTDLSESGSGMKSSSRKAEIKLHHNVGLNFILDELTPLDDQVKDTARNIGRAIGVPEDLLTRHPFPGPGLVVRIAGEVTAEKLVMARQLDGIFIEELRRDGLVEAMAQAGVKLTNTLHTTIMGDDRGVGLIVAFWGKETVNYFTGKAVIFQEEFVRRLTARFHNEVEGVGSVFMETSDKPPATFEMG